MTVVRPDLIVVGAGIFGLSIAWEAHRRGLSVQVVEAERVGAGASGGIVGALTPHAPSRWRPMMAFQFDALVALSDHVARLQEVTGLSTGYARSGRVTPLVSEKARLAAERDSTAAPETWGNRAEYMVLDQPPEVCAGWISDDAAPFGVALDTISARVDPRAYIAALAAAVSGSVHQGSRVERIDPVGRTVHANDLEVAAGAIVLASGWQVWDLVMPFTPALQGMPVKGQAAMFRAQVPELPVIYQDGLYMVPHEGGRIAVGSTSEKTFDDPGTTDNLLENVIDRARGICPALRSAEVVERWAGLRPKPPGREPVVGQLPGHPGIWIAAGGFKISFGIAHAVAENVVSRTLQETPVFNIPDTFDPARRLE